MFDPRPLLRLLAILLVLGTPLRATGAVWLIVLALRTPGNAPVTRVLGPDADSGFVLGAFGVSVAAGGDLDGDGISDMLVYPTTGELHVYYGGPP